MKFLPVALKGAILTSIVMSLVACGGASFGRKDSNKRGNAAVGDKLAGSVDDCYSLGNAPGQRPGQHPGQQPGYDDGYDTPTYDPKDEPVVYDDEVTYDKPCGGKPGQHPGQAPDCDYGYDAKGDCNPCDDQDWGCDNYNPIDTVPGYEPKPWPTQQPGNPGTCGKNGKYCDDGKGPGQWPGQTVGGGGYDRGDVEACMAAFRNSGYDTKGQWGIKVVEQKNVNVLGESIVEDRGLEHNVVIIKAVGVLGMTEFRLLNPNALYCIKNVAVLAETRVMSCLQSNVVWGRDVNVLSAAKSKVVDCRP